MWKEILANNDNEYEENGVFLTPFSLLLAFTGFIFSYLYWIHLGVPTAGKILLACSFIGVSLPFLYKRFSHFTFFSNLLIFLLFFAVITTSLLTGGMDSPGIYWVITVPVLSIFLYTPKGAMVWYGIIIGTLIYIDFSNQSLQLQNLDKIRDLESFHVTSIIAAMTVIFLISLYTNARKNSFRKLALEKKSHELQLKFLVEATKNSIQLAHEINNPLTKAILTLERSFKKNNGQLTPEEYSVIKSAITDSGLRIKELTQFNEAELAKLVK